MTYTTAFHEICHLWVLIFHLEFNWGKAYVKDIGYGREMATVKGFHPCLDDLEDLEDTAQYMVAGIAGEYLLGEFNDDDDIFDIFESEESYSQDFSIFSQAYDAAVSNHNQEFSAEEWFDNAFNEVIAFLESTDRNALNDAANYFLKHEDYEIKCDHQ